MKLSVSIFRVAGTALALAAFLGSAAAVLAFVADRGRLPENSPEFSAWLAER
jgi:hypothetical protein